MSKELLTELGHKNEVFKRWNQQQVAQEEYGLAVPSCRNEGRKVKANQELPQGAGDVKENNIGFHNYIISKRKTRKNMGPLLNGQESWRQRTQISQSTQHVL